MSIDPTLPSFKILATHFRRAPDKTEWTRIFEGRYPMLVQPLMVHIVWTSLQIMRLQEYLFIDWAVLTRMRRSRRNVRFDDPE